MLPTTSFVQNEDFDDNQDDSSDRDTLLAPSTATPIKQKNISFMLATVTINDDPAQGDEEDNDEIAKSQKTPLNRAYEDAEYRKNAYVCMFPVCLEKRFEKIDDSIIKVCQQFHGKMWYYISMTFTGFVAIELAIAAPFVLYFSGYDGLATEFTYLALVLALVSQVPKRFLWRFRPYMVHRAQMVQKDTTSSFPSRAVTCATVYSFAIIWGYVYRTMENEHTPVPFSWWMPFLFIFSILAASFARVNLGVHYPSDCVAGVLQGVFICIIGTGFWKADIGGCKSCRNLQCYTPDPVEALGFGTLYKVDYLMVIIVLLISTIIPFISVMKPIDFWKKCDRVYGMLLPGIAFHLLFLCPNSSWHSVSLPPPTHPVHWYSMGFGCGLAGLCMIVCMRIKGLHPFIVYFVLYTFMLVALVMWRLADL